MLKSMLLLSASVTVFLSRTDRGVITQHGNSSLCRVLRSSRYQILIQTECRGLRSQPQLFPVRLTFLHHRDCVQGPNEYRH